MSAAPPTLRHAVAREAAHASGGDVLAIAGFDLAGTAVIRPRDTAALHGEFRVNREVHVRPRQETRQAWHFLLQCAL